MDVWSVKNALRLQQREARDSMDPLTRQEASAVACRHAIEAWEQLRIDRNGDRLTVFSYLSFGSEISTTPFIEHCWSRGGPCAGSQSGPGNPDHGAEADGAARRYRAWHVEHS
nr:hypothetical protein [Paenibacillus sp. RC343]